MSIRQFELYHGAVLARIVRNDRPVTLRLIESKVNDAWAAYNIDDAATLYMKHISAGYESQNHSVWAWTFSFDPSQLNRLSQLQEKCPVYLVLICGQREVARGRQMEVCLLSSDQVNQCIDLAASCAQSIRVEARPGCELRVSGSKRKPENALLVPRNALDKFGICRTHSSRN